VKAEEARRLLEKLESMDELALKVVEAIERALKTLEDSYRMVLRPRAEYRCNRCGYGRKLLPSEYARAPRRCERCLSPVEVSEVA